MQKEIFSFSLFSIISCSMALYLWFVNSTFFMASDEEQNQNEIESRYREHKKMNNLLNNRNGAFN